MADALTLLGRGNSVMQRIRKAVGQGEGGREPLRGHTLVKVVPK